MHKLAVKEAKAKYADPMVVVSVNGQGIDSGKAAKPENEQETLDSIKHLKLVKTDRKTTTGPTRKNVVKKCVTKTPIGT